MTITTYPDLVQGTEEWLDLRCGMLTASVIRSLITTRARDAAEFSCPECGSLVGAACVSMARKTPTPVKTMHSGRVALAQAAPPALVVADNDTARGLTITLAAERITGHVEETPMTSHMWRGVEEEPLAREKYIEHHAPVEEVGFIVRKFRGYQIGYSPDGLVGKHGLIEIKSRLPKKQVQTVLADEIPAENMAQIQTGLLVTGRKWCDYVSYSGGMALWVKRVTPERKWFAVIKEAAKKFEADATEITTRYSESVAGLPMTTRTPSLEVRI